MPQKNSQKTLPNILTTLIKRTYSYAFRKLLLYPPSHTDSTQKIRHYDHECQAIQHIFSTLNTPIHRKKLISFFKIKTYKQLNPIRSRSLNLSNITNNKIKKIKRTNTGNQSLSMSNKKQSILNQSFNKQNQFKQLFTQIKNLTTNLTQSLPSKKPTQINTILYKLNKKKSLFSQIQKLQSQFNQFFENTYDSSLNSTFSSYTPSNYQYQYINLQYGKKIGLLSRH